MFLHIGKNTMIPLDDIIIIGDLESLQDTKISQEFLKFLPDNKSLNKEKDKHYRSIIVTKKGPYYSIISSNTLKERVNKKY